MKKKSFKPLIHIFTALLFTSFFCTNCQKDDVLVNSEQPNSNFKIQKIQYSEIQKNSDILSKIDNLKDKKVSKNTLGFNKTVYSSIYDFSIDTDLSTYIETNDGSYHSYTFPIHRTIDNGVLENLVLSLQEDGTYKSFIITYDLTTQEITDLKNGLYVEIGDRFDMVAIDDVNLNDDIFGKLIYVDCVVGSFTFWECGNGVAGHQPGNPGPPACVAGSFNYVIQAQWGTCAVDDGGSDVSSPNGENSSGGGGGPGSDPDDDFDPTDPDNHGGETVVSVPTVGDDTPPIITDPHIENLNKIVAIPKVKTELHRLKTSMGFSTQEDGKRFIYTGEAINNPDTYSDDTFTSQDPTSSESDALFFPPLEDNILIGAHFHPDLDSSIPPQPIRKVPSGTDLAEHIVMVKAVAAQNPASSPNSNQVTNFVVSKGHSGKTYAIRTNDEHSIVNLQGDYSVGGEERDRIAEELGEIIIAINPNNTAAQEEAIANFIAIKLPSLSIYVAVYNSQGEIINWIKL